MASFLILLLGLAVGILSGIIGIGGGVLIVPVLVYGYGMSQHRAQGTSLTALLAPVGLLAFLQYRKQGNVDYHVGFLLALGFFLGGWFGGDWAQHVSELWLRRIFGLVMLLLGVKMLL